MCYFFFFFYCTFFISFCILFYFSFVTLVDFIVRVLRNPTVFVAFRLLYYPLLSQKKKKQQCELIFVSKISNKSYEVVHLSFFHAQFMLHAWQCCEHNLHAFVRFCIEELIELNNIMACMQICSSFLFFFFFLLFCFSFSRDYFVTWDRRD